MDKVMGLDLGADDYIPKPFSVAELLARVRAALRRNAVQTPDERWQMGDVEVDPARHLVRKSEQDVELTAKEFEVLQLLKNAHGRVLSRQAIFDHVWGDSHHGTLRTIDNFVSKLRSKLEADPAVPRYLLTVRGVGYRLDLSGGGE
jgi:DNA-binding response OmpR family regulator